MKTRNLFLSLGLAGSAIALAALPSSSAKPQDPEATAPTKLLGALSDLESSEQKVSQNLDEKEALLANLQQVYNLESSDDQDVEVTVGNGNSWLGVQTREVTSADVKDLKLAAERGALVGKIVPDSPATKAGLKENDVITEVNGQRVEGTSQFRRMIREIPAGRSVQLTISRAGQTQSVNVTLGKMESHSGPELLRGVSPGGFAFNLPQVEELGDLRDFDISETLGNGSTRLGIDAEDLSGEFGNYFGAPDGKGVLVRNVLDDSPAAKAGLKAGDVIISLDGNPVLSVSELRHQLKAGSVQGKSLKIGLLRNKSEMNLNVELPARAKQEIRQRNERALL
jgi:serine protease Do